MTGPAAATGGLAPGAELLAVERAAFGDPVAQALIAALMADLDVRYAADGPAAGDSPEVAGLHAVRAEQVTPPRGVFLVARVGGEPAGCGALRPLHGGPPGVAEIKRMYTVPAARRRGVSRAILVRLEREALVLGYRRVQLETGLRQPEAMALYESAGYRRIASFGQYAGDELSVCYAKDLAARRDARPAPPSDVEGHGTAQR
ncbi:MAG TPA: GNAT family N-acetyltransferase [Acidimicrobiales bacterium]